MHDVADQCNRQGPDSYGLRGILPQTLEDLSDEMGLTRERVRQIQLESLRRLRHMARESGLDGQALFS